MDELEIQLDSAKSTFLPGETISGTARWSLGEAAKSIELELFWTTRGKGTVDTAVVDALCIEQPPLDDQRPFRFQLPASPYSFSGRLVSVTWSLRMIANPGERQAQVNIVVSPTGKEIVLRSEI